MNFAIQTQEIEQLKKGSRIPTARLAKIVGLGVEHPQFSLRCAHLAKYIEDRMEEIGQRVVVVQQSMELAVLTDQEAKDYLKKRDRQRLRQMVSDHARLTVAVDRSQLDSEAERNDYDRMLYEQGSSLVALHKIRRAPQLKPAGRATPGELVP